MSTTGPDDKASQGATGEGNASGQNPSGEEDTASGGAPEEPDK